MSLYQKARRSEGMKVIDKKLKGKAGEKAKGVLKKLF